MKKRVSLNMKSNLNDKAVDEFLNCQKKSTFFTYKSGIKLYLEFTKKTGQQLLTIKENDKNFQVENSLFQFRSGF
jgi:predicted DNA-binding protein (MmcQ/YjbR family)